MAQHMTTDEWTAFCSATLHGPPPHDTLMRIYATVDKRTADLLVARAKLQMQAATIEEMRAHGARVSSELKAAREQVSDLAKELARAHSGRPG